MTIQQVQQSSKSDKDEIDFGKLLGILLDSKWLIIFVTFVFACSGVIYSLLATPIYKSDALVQVESKSTGIPGLSDISEMFSSESTANTEQQIIKSRMVLGKTVDKLNLAVSVEPKLFPIVGRALSRFSHQTLPTLSIQKFEVPKELLNQPLTFTLLDKEHFKLAFDDNVLLTGDIGIPNKSEGIVLSISSVRANPGDVFIIKKSPRLMTINQLKNELSVYELGKNSGILGLSLEGASPSKIEAILNSIASNYLMQNVDRTSAQAEQSLQFLSKHVPEIRQKLDVAESKLNAYKLKRDSVDLQLEAQAVLKSMVEIESQLNELTIKEADVQQKYTKSHPAYVALMEKRKTLETQKARIEKQIEAMPKTQQEVIRLNRDVEVNQQIYLQLVSKMQELSVMKASAVGNVRILDHAATLESPVRPKKFLIILISIVVGVILSTLYVLIRATLHKGVEDPDQIEAIGLSVYASVPKSEQQLKIEQAAKRDKHHHLHILAHENPADLSIEALRGLRTSLHFAMMEAKNNILMISGPAPGIGKSFVCGNFAVVAATSGKRVLLVDADMRKGYMQKAFGLRWDNGLSDFLCGKKEVEDIIKSTGIDNLDIITRGQVPPNPSELLMHPRCKKFVEWASANYDLVIMDTPPVLAVTDPCIVGALAGTTLMVGRFGQNSVKEIEVANRRFEQAGIEVKGFILNAIERKASATYGEYGYYEYSYHSEKS